MALTKCRRKFNLSSQRLVSWRGIELRWRFKHLLYHQLSGKLSWVWFFTNRNQIVLVWLDPDFRYAMASKLRIIDQKWQLFTYPHARSIWDREKVSSSEWSSLIWSLLDFRNQMADTSFKHGQRSTPTRARFSFQECSGHSRKNECLVLCRLNRTKRQHVLDLESVVWRSIFILTKFAVQQ